MNDEDTKGEYSQNCCSLERKPLFVNDGSTAKA